MAFDLLGVNVAGVNTFTLMIAAILGYLSETKVHTEKGMSV